MQKENRHKQTSERMDDSAQSETVWVQASQWISRTLAVTLVMVLPGILGSMLDKRWGTSFIALLGFAIGLIAGTTGLLVLAKRFTPEAKGKPLPWDDEPETEDGKEGSGDHADIADSKNEAGKESKQHREPE